jgi:hypothetical protein
MDKCIYCGDIVLGNDRNLKHEAIDHAMNAANIDGYGDEGAGYDMEVFAHELEQHGWSYK